MLLVGDIGGTKTELAVFSSVTALSTPLAHATFPSARYAGFAEIVHAFLTRFTVQIDRVCLGVAGPVFADQAGMTALGIGPQERFPMADKVLATLEKKTLQDLLA